MLLITANTGAFIQLSIAQPIMFNYSEFVVDHDNTTTIAWTDPNNCGPFNITFHESSNCSNFLMLPQPTLQNTTYGRNWTLESHGTSVIKIMPDNCTRETLGFSVSFG